MAVDLADLDAFVAVARSRGFRDAARGAGGRSASALSDAVRRLERELQVRLLHRTTRSVAPTEAGRRLLERLHPALGEVRAALGVIEGLRARPSGTLRLNVPVAAARLALPAIVPGFLAAYPDIRIEIVAEDDFVDLVAAGFDAGIRYEERLEQDMIAVPIGPRRQRYACAAAPAYLDRHGRPAHPDALLGHRLIEQRFRRGATFVWEFERGGETITLQPSGPLLVQAGTASDLAVAAAIGGAGLVYLFEDWLRPDLESGALESVLEDWWPSFSGPFLYYPGRRLLPVPLRAFVDYLKTVPV